MTPGVHRLVPILKQATCGTWVIASLFRLDIILDHPKDDNGRLVPRERPVEVARHG